MSNKVDFSKVSRFNLLWPGVGIKRCLLTAMIGFGLICLGLILLTNNSWALNIESHLLYISNNYLNLNISYVTIDWIILLIGLLFLIWSVYQEASYIYSSYRAHPSATMIDALSLGRRRDRGLKIVALGGGTGLSTLLRGMKKHTSNITAIVSVSDNGGSSGRLSKELGMLPPGDIRNCITALADDEDQLTELFRYRFHEGNGLEGHSFGNLFLAALNDIHGDFEVALEKGSKLLAIRGKVLPATLTATTLCARLRDGRIIRGESEIPEAHGEITDVFLEPSNCSAPPEVIKAIGEADAIILGPGSLYTSVMPNLLIKNIVTALSKTKAPIIYVCNVMTQTGETDNYTAADHLQAIYHHVKKRFIGYVIANSTPPTLLREKYAKEGAIPVVFDRSRLRSMGVIPVATNLVKEDRQVRHDPDFLADSIMDLLGQIQFYDSISTPEQERSKIHIAK